MTIEPQELRRVMGHFATGVTVITTKDKDGTPQGLTANAFMSLSLNPPLVLISVDKGAASYACFETGNGYTVNFLGEEQPATARCCSLRGNTSGCRLNSGSRFRVQSSRPALSPVEGFQVQGAQRDEAATKEERIVFTTKARRARS
ncbi:MAG: flavin reductase family protein [Deltaproteobacteria bacterium]|nr:flavin reductase family protein [Deltaproteobacteria bacterium]